MSGITFSQRDIVLVPFIFSDFSGQKYRPALILSNKEYNNINNNFICCAITSNINQECRGLLVTNDHLDDGALIQNSVLIPPHIVNIKKHLVRKKFGILNKEKSREAIEFLNLHIDLD